MSEFESEFENDMDVQMLKRMERDQMTQTPKAEEVAEHLIEYDNVIRELDYARLDDFKNEIVQALTAYADERVKEAITKEREEALSRGGHWIRSEDYAGKIQQARAEGLEEAARIADGIAENYFQVYRKAGYKGPGNEGSQAASAAATNIRALKEKP